MFFSSLKQFKWEMPVVFTEATYQHLKSRGLGYNILGLSLLFAALNLVSPGAMAEHIISSPDGNVVVRFELKELQEQPACAVYSVTYKCKAIVVDSRLGLVIKDGPALEAGLDIISARTSSNNNVWSPVYGEREIIRDNYNQLVVELKKADYLVTLTLRAYDHGAAFCYILPKQKSFKDFTISEEKTQFHFTADHTAWAAYRAQGNHKKTLLSQLKDNCERPLVIEMENGPFAAIAEARLVDYARMRLSPDKDRPNTLVSSLGSEVEASTPYTTPWRVLILGDTPGDLLERNYLLLNLNKPCALKDTSWIKPGKVIREVTLTTTGGKACVDFAAAHNLQYVHFDAGWYGNEYDKKSDATTVTVDPKRSKGPLDLHAVIEYARKRDIGIILYVNRRALERQLDEILPLYESWGIKGVKYGFVQVGSQRWTRWLHEAVRKAAKYHLMVDIHDEYRPTGYSRTYPNLMTQEGIGGDETKPSNNQTLAILFTRMLAGAADNTICYFDERVDKNASHAYQLAKAVCLYSPWQFLYWYDRPGGSPQKAGGAGGNRNVITDEPELEFFDHVPTVWDDTKVIHGSIGEYAVIARRSGNDWYIGCMNSTKARTLEVPLSFLSKSNIYIANIYSDDPSVQTRTHVRIDRFPVTSETVLKVAMTAKGGQAIRITPAVSKNMAEPEVSRSYSIDY